MGAFTPERLEIIQLLTAQAAISIENAKLYTKVRTNENRLTQFLEAMPVGVAILDANGKPCYMNLVAQQLLGKGAVESVTPEQLPEVYQLYRAGTNQLYPKEQMPILRALQGDRSTVDDMEIHQGTTIIPVEARGLPIFDENGNIIYAIAAFQDITERRQAEIAKSTFLAQMSHELRTPLNAILGFAQLMSNSSYLLPEHQEHLNVIARSGKHLLTLINQVLDLSKIEAGAMSLSEGNIDLYCLLDDVETMFQPKANDKGLHLLFERSPDVPQYLYTDESKLQQVLTNLLSNAVKFTKAGSISLKVKTHTESAQHTTINDVQADAHRLQKIVFEVEDTGVGIAPDELDGLFEAFVQSKTTQTFQEGTGLGLTIARSCIRLMGGDISVSSQLSKGTVFKFDITVIGNESLDHKHQQSTSREISLQSSRRELTVIADILSLLPLLPCPPI